MSQPTIIFKGVETAWPHPHIASHERNSCHCVRRTSAVCHDLLDKVGSDRVHDHRNISGKGHHGVREAHFMFSEQESLVMIGGGAGRKVEPVLADYGRCSTATQGHVRV